MTNTIAIGDHTATVHTDLDKRRIVATVDTGPLTPTTRGALLDDDAVGTIRVFITHSKHGKQYEAVAEVTTDRANGFYSREYTVFGENAHRAPLGARACGRFGRKAFQTFADEVLTSDVCADAVTTLAARFAAPAAATAA